MDLLNHHQTPEISRDRNKEDFTLLNLSDSDSSSGSTSEQLFGKHNHHHQTFPLPNRKKRLRSKRRLGLRGNCRRGSSTDSNHHNRDGTSALFKFGNINVIYALILVLLSWSATISWLLFSLRTEIVNSDLKLSTVQNAAMKDLPSQLEYVNKTLETLRTNYTGLSSQISRVMTQITASEKNVSSMRSKQDGIADTLASIGSQVKQLEDQLNKLEERIPKSVKAKAIQTPETSSST